MRRFTEAMLAVLPRCRLPVGGIGAASLGLGLSLYKPGDDVVTVTGKAAAIVAAGKAPI